MEKKSQIVAPLIKIVAFSVKKIWGSFWLFLAQNVALPNSKHLDTLFKVLKDVAKTSSYIIKSFFWRTNLTSAELIVGLITGVEYYAKFGQTGILCQNLPELDFVRTVWIGSAQLN